MNITLPFMYREHLSHVKLDCDWGGPCEYQGICNCGWSGTIFGDVLHIDGSGIIGNRYTAFAEVLDHMGLSKHDYLKMTEAELGRYLENIKKSVDEVNKLRENLEAIRDLV